MRGISLKRFLGKLSKIQTNLGNALKRKRIKIKCPYGTKKGNMNGKDKDKKVRELRSGREKQRIP